MNAVQLLSLQPWVERLGWTLSFGPHGDPASALPRRPCGTGGHDGRSPGHVGADAPVLRASGDVSGPFAGHTPVLLNIRGSKVRVADLIRELAFVLDRPVLDKTTPPFRSSSG